MSEESRQAAEVVAGTAPPEERGAAYHQYLGANGVDHEADVTEAREIAHTGDPQDLVNHANRVASQYAAAAKPR
jgi:hypothetical protein